MEFQRFQLTNDDRYQVCYIPKLKYIQLGVTKKNFRLIGQEIKKVRTKYDIAKNKFISILVYNTSYSQILNVLLTCNIKSKHLYLIQFAFIQRHRNIVQLAVTGKLSLLRDKAQLSSPSAYLRLRKMEQIRLASETDSVVY